MMCATWVSAVLLEMTSAAAIWLLDSPWATSAATSSSRRVSPGGDRQPPLRVPLELDVAVAFAEPGAFGEPQGGCVLLPGTQQDKPVQQQRQLHPDRIAGLAVQGEGALEQRAAFAWLAC